MILNSGGFGLSCCRTAAKRVPGMKDGIDQAEVHEEGVFRSLQAEVQEEDAFRALLDDLDVETRNVMCDLMEEGEKRRPMLGLPSKVIMMSRRRSSKEMRARTHSSQPVPGWSLPHPHPSRRAALAPSAWCVLG